MPDTIELPADVENRFNKKFPGKFSALRHVGKLYGASFVSEVIESFVIIDREEARQFLADELAKVKASQNASQNAYRSSKKGKASTKAYQSTEKYKAYQKAYYRSEKGKAYQKAYYLRKKLEKKD